MANPGQPTISLGATGDAVRRLERALRRTPDLGLTVDGVFGAQVETAVKQFQDGAGLVVDGIVGPLTWAALPDGGPMPLLQVGSTGAVVSSLQTLLTNGAAGEWNVTPQGIDGVFGPQDESLGRGLPGLGRCRRGRDRRRSDLVSLAARDECHARERGRSELRHRLSDSVLPLAGTVNVRWRFLSFRCEARHCAAPPRLRERRRQEEQERRSPRCEPR